MGKNKCKHCNQDVESISDILENCNCTSTCTTTSTCPNQVTKALDDLEDNLCGIKKALEAIKKLLVCLAKTLSANDNLCCEEKNLLLAINKQIKIIECLLKDSNEDVDDLEDLLS